MEPSAKRLRYIPGVQQAIIDAQQTVRELADVHVDAHAQTELSAALERIVEANVVEKQRIATETALRMASECSSALGIMLRGDADVRVDLFCQTFVRKLLQRRRSDKDDGELDEEWVEEFLDFHLNKGNTMDELVSIICSLLESQGGVDLVPSLLTFLPKNNYVFLKLCDDCKFNKQQCKDAAYTLTDHDPRLVDWVAPVTDTTARAAELRVLCRRSLCSL